VFAERIARPARPGLLHTLDPRIKLLSIVGLIVAATFLHHVPSLWLLAGFIAAAAALSRIPAGALFHRLWWSVPLVFVIAALPAALNLVTPGDSLLTIYRVDEAVRLGRLQLPPELAITSQGLASAALVTTRLFVGVLFAVTLTLTTRWDDLLKAAYGRATAPFVLVLTMAYRYRWIGRRVGALFSRSRHLTERVYSAMLARGYRGEPKALTAFHLGGAEAAWLLACASVASLALLADRLLLVNLPW
jgi:cobalt/nickel transport system permease protein